MGRKMTLFLLLLALLVPAVSLVSAQEDITIDIKPCKDPNVLNVNQPGPLPVAIYGLEGEVDDILLQGVSALEWFPKGDYLLAKFDAQEVIEALGDVSNGDEVTLTLTVWFDGTSVSADDTVIILKRGNRP